MGAASTDDLDKQDPSQARQLLHDGQGMLKGGDLIRRLPTERAAIFMPTPMITELPEEEPPATTD